MAFEAPRHWLVQPLMLEQSDWAELTSDDVHPLDAQIDALNFSIKNHQLSWCLMGNR